MNSTMLLLFTLFLISNPLPTLSISFSTYQTLFSLSHSLMARVANLRKSRGDIAGSERASAIAKKLERGIGFTFWKFMWSMGWDYFRNYSWRDMSSFNLFGAVSEMNELMRGLNELNRMDTEERVAWLQRNYSNVLRTSKSLFDRLLKVFRQPSADELGCDAPVLVRNTRRSLRKSGLKGPLREVIEALQREVVEGDLLRDCLELGGNDFKGFLQILKDLAIQSSSTGGRTEL